MGTLVGRVLSMVLKLRNHIPLSAPATREPADGTESDMRVSLGFEPAWFHRRCGIDFSEPWHRDPHYRYQSLRTMKTFLARIFPMVPTWDLTNEEDLGTLSGCFGACLLPSVFGLPLRYTPDRWPAVEPHRKLTRDELEKLDAGRLLESPFVEQLFRQMDILHSEWGKIHGYLNWQGVLNNAFHIRGPELFIDLYDHPEMVHHLFAVISEVMIQLAGMVQERQRASGFYIDLFSVSNCTVNMISPSMYRQFLFPHDMRIALRFERFGVHTCNWDITPYAEVLRELPNLGYLDMGMASDLVKIKKMFPETRRAVMYSPSTLEEASVNLLRQDMERVYRELAPCDVVMADIQASTPDQRVIDLLEICRDLDKRQPL